MEDIAQVPLEVIPNVQQLLGMSFLEVREKLGQPIWIRDVYPARVWGYDMETCSLQVFFYPKLDQAGDYRVLAYESGTQNNEQLSAGLAGKEEPSPSDDSAIITPGDDSSDLGRKIDQELVQVCFQKLLDDSVSAKEVIQSKKTPES